MTVKPDKANKILASMRQHKYGKEASIIGEIKKGSKGKVILKTEIGGKRVLHTPVGELYPRIC
jgi:hydrogenase expression/formation protein HypE